MSENRTIETDAKAPLDSARPSIVGLLPGAIMFRVPAPHGTPDMDNPRAAQIFSLKGSSTLSLTGSPTLAHIAADELSAVVESLWTTHQKFLYHYGRFWQYAQSLADFRQCAPGEVFYDSLAAPLHFELQGLCGAARTCLDEIVYLVARRYGVPPRKATQKPWETSKLISEPLPASCNTPEIQRLRARSTWFATLNAYRNSAHHHGWRFGGGHYDYNDRRKAAKSPAMNALLLPDVSSLVGRRKPFEWTWNSGARADSVAELVYRGLDELLFELCAVDWGMPVPPPGTAPPKQRPTAIVNLHIPAILEVGSSRIVAFFSTREGAARCDPFIQPQSKLELVEVPVSSLVTGKPAVTFCLRGLQRNSLPTDCVKIDVLIDPVPTSADWLNIETAALGQLSVDNIFEVGPEREFSIVVNEGVKCVYGWREPFLVDRQLML